MTFKSTYSIKQKWRISGKDSAKTTTTIRLCEFRLLHQYIKLAPSDASCPLCTGRVDAHFYGHMLKVSLEKFKHNFSMILVMSAIFPLLL